MRTTTLAIHGYHAAPVPNTFIRQEHATSHLAVVLPGLHYTCDAPLLYLTTSHLLDLGADVVQVEYGYGKRQDWGELPAAEQARWLGEDVTAACRVALAQRAYTRVTIVAKSLGTRALPDLLAAEGGLAGARVVWLTPLLGEAPVREHLLQTRQPALIVIGTADPHHDPEIVAALQATGAADIVVVAGADHGLEVAGDVIASVKALEVAMRAIQHFPGPVSALGGGSVHLCHFAAAADFTARATPFLMRDEASNNLLLGLCSMLVEAATPSVRSPNLVTVEAEAKIVAAYLMTPPNRAVLALTDSLDAVALIADDVARRVPDCPGVLGPTRESSAFAARWQAVTGQAVRAGVAQRIYQADTIIAPTDVPGAARIATQADRPLLTEWLTAFNLEAHGQNNPEWAARAAIRTLDSRLASQHAAYFLWCDGVPVSLAGYSGPTPSGMRVGPVYTPPSRRGRGYGSAVTAAVSQWLLDSERRYCFLYTDLSNPTSNRIYQAIGYRPVRDIDEYNFGAATQ